MGQVPPSFFDYVLSRKHADGIFLAGCTDQGCHYRLGSDWTSQRIGRTRDPRLRKRIDASAIEMHWTDSPDGTVLSRLQAFNSTLAKNAGEQA